MTETMLTAVLAGFAVLPGTFTDALGSRFGGISSLRWDAANEVLVALPDRGYFDGKVPYTPRFHEFRVIEEGDGFRLDLKSTTLFQDENGEAFSGLIETELSRLDPEGIVVAPDGSLFVSDEYGPSIFHFARNGRYLGRLRTPKHFLPGKKRGRVDNRGFEGLCLAPDGRTLATVLQSPLAQDGGKRGAETRMLLYDLERPDALPREFRVPMPPISDEKVEPPLKRKDMAFNECEAVTADSYLLLERDNRGLGADPGRSTVPSYKRVVRVDLADGRAKRTPFLDLLPILRKGGLDPSTVPVKYESLAWGRADGERKFLWVAVDNDFEPTQPTYFFRLELR